VPGVFGTPLDMAGWASSSPWPAKSSSDPRFKAAMAMSAAVDLRGDPDKSYGTIRIPILHMTGTRDDSPIGETRAGQRRIPFDHIHGADQYLVTLEGGDHMIFAGQPSEAAWTRRTRSSTISSARAPPPSGTPT